MPQMKQPNRRRPTKQSRSEPPIADRLLLTVRARQPGRAPQGTPNTLFRLPRPYYRLLTAYCLLLTAYCLLLTSTAYAHTRVEIGPYVVVVGWQNEPVVSGERNALTFEFSEGEQPVSGVEAALDAEVSYGGRTTNVELNPTETPGLYTAELYPTVRGQYSVRLFGTLGETAVDEEIEPEEVLPAAQLQFPEALPDTLALQEQIATLQGQMQTARTVAFVAAGVGLLGLVLAAVGFLRK